MFLALFGPISVQSRTPKETKLLQTENTASLKKGQEKHLLVLITNYQRTHEMQVCQSVLSVPLKGGGTRFRKTRVKTVTRAKRLTGSSHVKSQKIRGAWDSRTGMEPSRRPGLVFETKETLRLTSFSSESSQSPRSPSFSARPSPREPMHDTRH